MSKERYSHSTARLAWHSLWNILGMALPMVVGLFAIPFLIQGLGEERFGALTLVWMIVGYFGILDMGMGPALTKLVAERLGANREDEVHPLFWTAVITMVGIGILLGMFLFASAEPLANEWLKVSPEFQEEVQQAFRIVAWGLPVVILTVGLIGVLEAYEQFAWVNILRLPFGCFSFLGPLLALPFSKELPVLVAVLIAGRAAEILTYGALCLKVAPVLRNRPRFSRELLQLLLGFGGWMTVSNLLLPLMIHVDRFLIGGLISVAVVAFYTTPAELVVKMLILPRAWISVLFPRFAAGSISEPEKISRLCIRSLRLLWVPMFPLALGVVCLSHEFLLIWLGPDKGPLYAEESTTIMQLLAIGMYVYAPAYVPYAFTQAIGYPKRTAVVHMLELPLYLCLLVIGLTQWGLVGGAVAWLLRAVLDMLGMLRAAWPDLRDRRGLVGNWLLPYVAGAFILLGLVFLTDVASRLIAAGLGLGVFGVVAWWVVLERDDRSALRSGSLKAFLEA